MNIALRYLERTEKEQHWKIKFILIYAMGNLMNRTFKNCTKQESFDFKF